MRAGLVRCRPVVRLSCSVLALALAPHLGLAQTRPRIGLALSGGSARGLAHVGVLRWLEEHQIPVDAIAGTSIGGLVGGGYATGRSADELATLVTEADWDLLFLGDVPFDLKDFRRKEDRRQYPVRFELGLRDGLGVASGLDPGHQVGLFLSRMAYPYAAPLDFDELPIPFRAVATDLERAEVVTLGRGSLARALRSTMALPGIFAPVELDGRLLADGGVLNNVPVDVVRAMNVDHVIAVDVGAELDDRRELRSALQLASQALAVMMAERTRALLKAADAVIEPGTSEFGSTDWRRAEELIRRGYDAAAAVADDLLPLAVDVAEWDRHLAARQTRRQQHLPAPAYIDIQGLTDGGEETIHARLASHLDRPLDVSRLERDLTRLAGAGPYESLMYEVAQDGSQTGLWVDVKEKAYGPPFVNVSLDVANAGNDVTFGLGSRVTFMDGVTGDAETRVDVELGSDLATSVEHFQPLGDGPVFVAARAGYSAVTRNFFVDGDPFASYRERRAGAGGDLGLALGTTNEIRVGYDIAAADASLRIGDPFLPEFDGREQAARARWVYDGQDHWIVPTRGTRAETDFRWLFEGPDTQAELRQLSLHTSTFFSIGPRDRVFVGFRGGTSFDDTPGPFQQFRLGGPFRLGAFDIDQFQGDHLLSVSGGYLRQVGRLPDFVGGPIYLLGGVEAGSAFDSFDAATVHTDVVGGVVVETSIGPVFVTGSVATTGAGAFYFGIGRIF